MAAEQSESEAGTETRPEGGNAHSVGALLKASRLRVGEDLEEIADILRIRYVYLEAIEDGRFEDLPGPAYATGFIRAYADHLGLDSDEVVRRFKNRDADDAPKTSLDFPEPIPEPGIPGGAIVFVGIVVAVLAYGAWYVNTAKNGLLVELISPLPERLAAPEGTTRPAPGLEPPEVTELAEPTAPGTAAEPEPAPTPEAAAPAGTASETEPAVAAELAAEAEPETAARPETPAPGGEEAPAEAAPDVPADVEPETAPAAGREAPGREAGPPPAAEMPPPAEGPAAAGLAEMAAPSAAEPVPSGETAPTPTDTAAQAPSETPAEAPAEAPVETAARPEAADASAPAADIPFAEVYPPPAPEAEAQEPVVEAAEPTAAASASPSPEPAPAPGLGAVPVDLIPAASPAPDPAETAAVPVPAAATPSEAAPAAPEAEPAAGAEAPPASPAATTAVATVGGRIVVRARTNSWIQVRDDAGGQLLVTRLLRAGDSYAVPDRPGLRLSTGNAGALVILVDGEAVPAIGEEGTVRRDVALDAEKLKAGTAVGR